MSRLALLALLLLAPGAGAQTQADPWGFGSFLAPVRAHAARAEVCRACHPAQHAQWSGSRHQQSMGNAVFLDGLAAEPHARCVYCHAPLEAQARDVLRQRAEVLRERSLAPLPPGSSAHEGITCSVCHVRNGTVLTPHPDVQDAAHPVRFEPRLTQSAFCAGCHEFEAHEVVDGRTRLTGEPMQTTYAEWQGWQAQGGQGTCQTCHMPAGAHTFRGAYDEGFLRGALSLRLEQEGAGGWVAVLASQGVGHAFPTGDVFRHLVVWADAQPVARFGQRFGLEEGPGGEPVLRRVESTALQPGVPARVALPPGTHRVRVTYHYTEERHARRGTLPPEALVLEVAAQDVPRR